MATSIYIESNGDIMSVSKLSVGCLKDDTRPISDDNISPEGAIKQKLKVLKVFCRVQISQT